MRREQRGTFLLLVTESGVSRDRRWFHRDQRPESTMTAFLPPISQTTRLSSRLARPGLAGRLPNSQTDFARAGKCDHFHIRMIDQVLRR